MFEIARYSVTKYFGHFRQCWNVEANSDEDAWNRAERDGSLQYQSVYREPTDLESKGYIVNLDEKRKEDPPISTEQYYEWMREAIDKGMIVRPDEYEKALGLPFNNVW